MNIIGALALLLAGVYSTFLCIWAIRRLKTLVLSKSPHDILETVVASRRHYGFHTFLSVFLAIFFVGIKAAAVILNKYYGFGAPARLAFGTTNGEDIISKLGLAACLMFGAAVVLAVSFIKYNAYLRMLFALRTPLNLNLELTSSGASKIDLPIRGRAAT